MSSARRPKLSPTTIRAHALCLGLGLVVAGSPAFAGARDLPGGSRATTRSERAEAPRRLETSRAPAASVDEIGHPTLYPDVPGAWRAPEPSGRPRLEERVIDLAPPPPAPRIDSLGTIPLTLQQCIELAIAHQLDIQGSRIDRASAEARIGQERGPFDPVLSGVLQHDRSVRENAFVFAVPLSESTGDTYRAGISQKLWYGATYEVGLVGIRQESNSSSLSPEYSTDLALKYTQPLLRGFGRDANRSALAQAINSERIADLNVQARARDIVRDTVRAYWELVFAIRDLEVRRSSLGLANELLRKNRIMVEVGTMAPLEVSQAEASVALREFGLISAEEAIGNAEDTLRRLIGVREDSSWWNAALAPVDEPEFAAISADLDEEISTAIARREELPSQQLAIENAKLGLAAAKDSLLPQLNFEISSGWAGLTGFRADDPLLDENGDGIFDNDGARGNFGSSFGETFGHDFESYTTALIYSQPLRNRSAEGAWLAQRLALEDARLSLAQLRQTVTLEVRAAVRRLDSSRDGVVSAGASRQLQEKTLQAEIKKFENGLSTNFEVLQFQTDLQESESSEVRALIDYLQAQAELRRARGTLLEDYGLQAPR